MVDPNHERNSIALRLATAVWPGILNCEPMSEAKCQKSESQCARTFGEETNRVLWRLARMKCVISNPKSKIERLDVDVLREDVRWGFGVPASGKFCFARVQHSSPHLSTEDKIGSVPNSGDRASSLCGVAENCHRL